MSLSHFFSPCHVETHMTKSEQVVAAWQLAPPVAQPQPQPITWGKNKMQDADVINQGHRGACCMLPVRTGGGGHSSLMMHYASCMRMYDVLHSALRQSSSHETQCTGPASQLAHIIISCFNQVKMPSRGKQSSACVVGNWMPLHPASAACRDRCPLLCAPRMFLPRKIDSVPSVQPLAKSSHHKTTNTKTSQHQGAVGACNKQTHKHAVQLHM